MHCGITEKLESAADFDPRFPSLAPVVAGGGGGPARGTSSLSALLSPQRS